VGFTVIPFLSMSLRELHFRGSLNDQAKINPFLPGVLSMNHTEVAKMLELFIEPVLA
jgi:hypothetical protein